MKKMVLFFLVSTLSIQASGCGLREKIRNFIDDQLGINKPAPTPPTIVIPPTPPVIQNSTTQPTSLPSAIPSSQPTSQAAIPESIPLSDDALLEEINGYIECMNRTGNRTLDSKNRYLSWVSKGGPTCKETYISYGLYTLYEDGIQKCNQAADRGKLGAPQLPTLEKSAADLARAYAELVPLVKKASDYFDQQDYKDDQCAKAKEMHPQLLASFDRFFAAQKELKLGTDLYKKQLDARQLQKLEKEKGKTLEWFTLNLSIAAKGLIETIPEDNSPMRTDVYLTQFTPLETAYNDLTTYSAAHADEASKAFWYSAFESSVKDFYTKSKFLKRDLAEGKKADGRSIQEVVNAYNRMVGDLNNIRFKFP
ncbi:MAG: DUF3829 domain-containing protein [Deltaproteobacteria bacterium]|nr:DUF3829 domain-containing protein [Deltaproteobacteria bacterium]